MRAMPVNLTATVKENTVENIQRSIAAATARDDARNAAQAVLNAVNSYGFDEKAFADAITNSHRTLQQSAMRAFLACIKTWADAEHYDGRNEATVKVSKRIVADFDGDLYLPFV